MTIESPIGGGYEKKGENLELKMEIQRALLEHSCGPGEDFEEHGIEWIRENSPNFKIIFDEMVKDNPDLDKEWAENETKVLDYIHGQLFQMKEAKKAA
ncbi:MAG: hypothetical protein WD874_02015 [Parcubacteria group bacterium]